MKKSLEDFAKENRAGFDIKKIDAGIWNRIAAEMKHNKSRPAHSISMFWRWGAAAVIILFLSATVFYLSRPTNFEKNNGDNIVQKQFPEYDSKIRSFAILIGNKKEELKTIEREHPEIYNQFNTHITGLGLKYEELKKEFTTDPNKNFLLNEMIENLELQVRLLNTQLGLIKQLKESMKSNDGKNTKNI